MCGIFGYAGKPCDGQLGLALIRRRGPDGLAFWSDEQGKVWLGHARLAIQDLSKAGAQPMHDPSGRFVMVYNGEIYNTPDLRAGLEASGETFVGHSDSEVLLRMFAREGSKCFARLNGIFAAAFWDRQSGDLTLVRDGAGVKPLYVDRRDGRFAFSSEMKALIRTHGRAPEVNRSALLRHLVYLWSPGEDTIAEGITKLLPGEVLVRKADGSETHEFFGDPGRPEAAKDLTDPEVAARTVRQCIADAVERQLLSDVPVGAFLSGGLDSSAVVALAAPALRDAGQGAMMCFTIKPTTTGLQEEGIADDLPYARQVAERFGVDLKEVEIGHEVIERLGELVYLLDEPNADPAPLNSLLISEMARREGIKVLLSGTGGDDVFTGYRRHVALQQEKYWRWLPRPARRLLRKATSALPKNTTIGRRLAKLFSYADRPADQRLLSQFQWLDPELAATLVAGGPEAADAVGAAQAPLRDSLARLGDDVTPLDRLLYLERRHFLADHNLTYTDKTGMAAGVEIRVPLIDNEVIACADRLPDGLRQHGLVSKWIFKKAMEPLLPKNVIYRPKSGFGAPLRRWLDGPLKPMADEILSAESLARRGLFDPAAVRRLLSDDGAGRIDATYPIFAIVCIEMWCRQFVDGNYLVDANIDTSRLDIAEAA